MAKETHPRTLAVIQPTFSSQPRLKKHQTNLFFILFKSQIDHIQWFLTGLDNFLLLFQQSG